MKVEIEKEDSSLRAAPAAADRCARGLDSLLNCLLFTVKLNPKLFPHHYTQHIISTVSSPLLHERSCPFNFHGEFQFFFIVTKFKGDKNVKCQGPAPRGSDVQNEQQQRRRRRRRRLWYVWRKGFTLRKADYLLRARDTVARPPPRSSVPRRNPGSFRRVKFNYSLSLFFESDRETTLSVACLASQAHARARASSIKQRARVFVVERNQRKKHGSHRHTVFLTRM